MMSDSAGELREDIVDEREGEGGGERDVATTRHDYGHLEEENLTQEEIERSFPSLTAQLQAEIPCLDNVLELLQNLHQSANDILTKVPEMCLSSVHVKNTMDLMKDLMKRFSDLRYSFDTLKNCFVNQVRDTQMDARRREEMLRLLDYKRRYMEQLVTAQESFSKTVDLVRMAVDTASLDVTEALRLRASQLTTGTKPGSPSRGRGQRSGDESGAPDTEDTVSESDGSSSSASGSSNASDIETRHAHPIGSEQLWTMMQRLLTMEVGPMADGNELSNEECRPIREADLSHHQQLVDEDKDLDEQVLQEQELRQDNIANVRTPTGKTSTSHRLPADGGSRQNAQPPIVATGSMISPLVNNDSDNASTNNPTAIDVQLYREKLARKIIEKEKSERQVEALRRARDELLARLHVRQAEPPGMAVDNDTSCKRSPGANSLIGASVSVTPNSNASPSNLAELRSRVVQLEAMRANLLHSMAQLEVLESAAQAATSVSPDVNAHSPAAAEASPLRRQRLEGDGGVLSTGILSTNPTTDTLNELMHSLNGMRGALQMTESTNTDVSASSVHSNENECYQDAITLVQERDRILNELKEIREKKRLLQEIEASAERSLLSETVDNDGESDTQPFPRMPTNRRNNQKFSRSSGNSGAQSSTFFGPSASSTTSGLLSKPLNNVASSSILPPAGVSGSATPVSVAPSTSVAFFSPKLSPQLLNGRQSANVINGYGDGNHDISVSSTTTNGGRDSVTFQEPVAKFIPNDELYENIRQARILREEERSRQGRNNVTLSGRGRHGNNRWKGCGASNTTYSDITTQATWGGSSSGGAMTMSQLDEEMAATHPNGVVIDHRNGARDMNFRAGRTGRERGAEEGGSTASRSISPPIATAAVRWCDDTSAGMQSTASTENVYEKRIRELEEQLHMKEALCHELVSQLAQQSALATQPTLNVSQRSSSTNVSHSPIVGGMMGLPATLQSQQQQQQQQQQRQQQEPQYSTAAIQQMATLCSFQTRFMFLQSQFQQLQQQMNMMSLSSPTAYQSAFLGAGGIPVPPTSLVAPVYSWQHAPMMPMTPMPWVFTGASGVNNGAPINASGISQGTSNLSAPNTSMNRDITATNIFPDWYQRLPGGQ